MEKVVDEGVCETIEIPQSLPTVSLFTTQIPSLHRIIQNLLKTSLSRVTLQTISKPLASQPIPSESSLSTFIQDLKEFIPESTLVSNPRQVGHMTSQLPLYIPYISELVTTLNQNLVKTETAASLSILETNVICDFASNFGMEGGICTSGGTIANLTGLWLARQKCRGVVIGSAMMHYSIKKSVNILGMEMILVKCDGFRVDVGALEVAVREVLEGGGRVSCLVAVAGTTEAGSFDDIRGICRIAKEFGIHVHVDAAWGGPTIFSKTYGFLMDGCNLADSMTVDGHKQLYTPMGLGMLLVRQRSDLEMIKTTAEYIIREGSSDLGKYGVEGSRPANFLYLHANLHIIGKKGIGELIDWGIVLVREMYNRLRSFPGEFFECIHEPMSNILLYRYIPVVYRHLGREVTAEENENINWFNESIQELSKSSLDPDTIFTSRTRVLHNSRLTTCLRVVICNPLTTFKIIESGIKAQLRVCRLVERRFYVRQLDTSWNGKSPVGLPWDL